MVASASTCMIWYSIHNTRTKLHMLAALKGERSSLIRGTQPLPAMPMDFTLPAGLQTSGCHVSHDETGPSIGRRHLQLTRDSAHCPFTHVDPLPALSISQTVYHSTNRQARVESADVIGRLIQYGEIPSILVRACLRRSSLTDSRAV